MAGCPWPRTTWRGWRRATTLATGRRGAATPHRRPKHALERGLIAPVGGARNPVATWRAGSSRNGRRLARLYREADLVITHAMETGLFDGLDAPELAGLISLATYEHRGSRPPPRPRFPNSTLRRRFSQIERAARQVNEAEEAAGLPLNRSPRPRVLVEVAYSWVARRRPVRRGRRGPVRR